ncbi:hypothetical protein CTAYLR_009943 [Chrysophaeum taylorii]|uniref:Uncharacterized protein n=1 Tax=Chrysophaeum taylorii TaxID=2483200 RepID=A0AAD7UFA6_9STRA|nr:hypothetical protein CTAYLR_009943 [Chrysophaeum taylorii]
MASGRRWGRVFVLARRGVSSKEEEMASRLLGVYALHQDLTRLSGDYYREIRAVRARLAAAAAPLHARRRAVLLGEEAPPAAQLEDEDMRESTRKAIDAALAGFDENQTGLSGLFWKEVLSSIEPAEEDVISEADKKMFGHLVDVRCAARIEGSAEVVSVEMEFGPGAPVEPKTLRAVFEKDAASGTFLKTTEVTVPEWSSNDANPTLKKIKGKAPPTPKGGKGKKKKKQQQQQPAPAPTKVKYVKATSFFHIFNHIENFEIFPDRDDIDDDVEAEDEDFEEESWYNDVR